MLVRGNKIHVGGGNSGAQIAVELSGGRETYLALGQQPRYLLLTIGGKSMFWWLDKLGILSAGGFFWVGRKLKRRRRPDFWI